MAILGQAACTASTNNVVATMTGAQTVNIQVANRSASPAAITAYLVPAASAGSPTNAMAIVSGLVLDGNCWLSMTGYPLGPGDQVIVNPSTANVSVSVFGLPIT